MLEQAWQKVLLPQLDLGLRSGCSLHDDRPRTQRLNSAFSLGFLAGTEECLWVVRVTSDGRRLLLTFFASEVVMSLPTAAPSVLPLPLISAGQRRRRLSSAPLSQKKRVGAAVDDPSPSPHLAPTTVNGGKRKGGLAARLSRAPYMACEGLRAEVG